jgi:hypothetical protein
MYIKAMFAAVNGLGVLLVLILWLYPMARDLYGFGVLLRIQESRLALKETNLKNYEANLLSLAEITQEESRFHLVAYERLAHVLGQITFTAESLGLHEREFSAAGAVGTDLKNGQAMYHMRVFTAYEGDYEGLLRFLRVLHTFPCHIDQLSLENGPTAQLRVQISLYGLGE